MISGIHGKIKIWNEEICLKIGGGSYWGKYEGELFEMVWLCTKESD